MKLSVVIATMNRSQDMEKALGSLAVQTRMPDEILIIDQSADEQTKKVCAAAGERYPNLAPVLKYFYQEAKSLVKARNRGIDESRGEIVSFLDDDVVLDPGYFEKIIAVFDKEPDVVAVSGNARIPQAWGGGKWMLRKWINRLFLISRYDGKMTPSGLGHPIYDRVIRRRMTVDMLPGCNMNYRRSAMSGERFDEFFTGYSYREDAEYSYRFTKKGKVVMIPDATLLHNYSTYSRLTEAQLKPMMIKNYHYMFKKFKGKSVAAKLFFRYSLFGMVFIDWIEFMTNRTPIKKEKLGASVRAVREAEKDL